MRQYEKTVEKVAATLVRAGSTFRHDKMKAYCQAIEKEKNNQAKWVMEQIVENANVAKREKSPLCDDTGIPHLFLEVGPNQAITGDLLNGIREGVMTGLMLLPGRPMAIKGNDKQRIDQSRGLSDNPADVLPAPIIIKPIDEEVIRLHILMQGGGPAIRGKSYRVFHKHNVNVVMEKIIEWAEEAVAQLGCSPSTLAIGIGRSHYEAAALMLEAQVYGCYDIQSEMEQMITDRVNKTRIGALGLTGDTSVLGTFLKVGPQRASGVRIVCLRPCCCFEPRIASVEL